MKIAIIGHGPSILRSSYGPEIDRHDRTVRIKRSWSYLVHPQFFGSATDYVMGSLTVAKLLVEGWKEYHPTFWLHDDTRTEGKDVEIPEGAICERDLCKRWREVYRELRPVIALGKAQKACGALSDECGHLHPSGGMHAIIYAMELLRPDQITLYGFDNVVTGRFTWSITRGDDWMEYPDHNWAAENEMITALCDHYQYRYRKVGDKGELHAA